VNSWAALISARPFHHRPTTFTNSASGANSSLNTFMSCLFQHSAKDSTTRVTSATTAAAQCAIARMVYPAMRTGACYHPAESELRLPQPSKPRSFDQEATCRNRHPPETGQTQLQTIARLFQSSCTFNLVIAHERPNKKHGDIDKGGRIALDSVSRR